LDIDQTIMSHAAPIDWIDFNGSNQYGDASAWVNSLTEIKTYCEERSFEFVVQIVSAKDGMDLLIRQVFNALHSFLLPLNKQGKSNIPFADPTEGYVSSPTLLYYMMHKDMIKRCRLTANQTTYIIADEELLPPIHLCRYNLISKDKFVGFGDNKSYSKALVMKYISEYFHDITPAENMFLLDDQTPNIQDIQQIPYGYQGVLAEELYRLEKGTKEERTIACHEILTTLKAKIKTRVDFILANELSNEEQNCARVNVQNNIPVVQPHEIHLAVKAGNLKRVRELITQNPSLIHAVDAFNQTPLLWAASKGYHDIVVFLIEKGGNVNQATQLPDKGSPQKNHNNTPLDWAIIGVHFATIDVLLKACAITNDQSDRVLLLLMIQAQNITQVQALIAHNKSLLNQLDNNGYTPLHEAALFGQVDIAHYLITEGAELDICTPAATDKYKNIKLPNHTAIEIACEMKNGSMVISLFEASAIVTPTRDKRIQVIHVLAQHGALNHVQTLIERYPELVHAKDTSDQTPLLWAASKGHHDIVKLLISKGANVNTPTQHPINHKHSRDNHYTPLDWAIAGGHTDVIFSLMDAGATTSYAHTTIKNKTLENLIKDNDFILVQILIKCNPALLNKLSDDGYAPLHYAAIYGHIGMIHFLIALEADVNITTAPVVPGIYSGERHHQMTAMKLWSLYHPLQKNVFNRYCRMQDLEKRKTQITTLIASQIPSVIWARYANLHNEKTILEDLKQKILQTTFKPTDSSYKTADYVLIEIIDVWTREWNVDDESPRSHSSKQSGFFPQSNPPPKLTLKVLQEIRSLLGLSSNKYQNIDAYATALIESEQVAALAKLH